MNRIAAHLSVASLFASLALLGAGCANNQPVDTGEKTARNTAALEADIVVDGAEDAPIDAVDPIAVGAAEAPVELGADPKPVAAEPKQCAGTWSYLPEGTDTWVEADGSLGYQLPAGFVSFETDPDTGAMYATAGGTITCSCTKGTGGCSPVSAGGTSGCFMGANCDTCSKSGATKVIDTNVGVAFASLAEVKDLPPLTPALLDVPLVADAFAQFKDMVAVDAGLPDGQALEGDKTGLAVGDHTFLAAPGWALAAVNVFGHVALVSVPESYGKLMAPAWGSSQKCACNAGSGCKAGSMLGAKYCDAGNCTSCSMSLSVAAQSDYNIVSTSDIPACSAE